MILMQKLECFVSVLENYEYFKTRKKKEIVRDTRSININGLILLPYAFYVTYNYLKYFACRKNTLYSYNWKSLYLDINR